MDNNNNNKIVCNRPVINVFAKSIITSGRLLYVIIVAPGEFHLNVIPL